MYCSMYRKQPHYYRGADSILNILLCHIEWHDGVMVSILHPGLCGRVTAFCSSARHLTTCSSHSDSLHHMYYVYRASDSQFCWFFRVTFVETKMAFSWEIHRNFWDKFCWKTISKKWPISWQFSAHNYFAAKRSVLHWFDKRLRHSLLKNLPMAVLSFFENDECWSVQ